MISINYNRLSLVIAKILRLNIGIKIQCMPNLRGDRNSPKVVYHSNNSGSHAFVHQNTSKSKCPLLKWIYCHKNGSNLNNSFSLFERLKYTYLTLDLNERYVRKSNSLLVVQLLPFVLEWSSSLFAIHYRSY